MSVEPVSYIQSNSKTQVAESLREVLANTYVLYFKTHSYHWNVEGSLFKPAHELFEEQYTEMWEAMDALAERLRALDVYAPINTEDMTKSASLAPATGTPDAISMVKELAEDNTKTAGTILRAIEVAQESGDEVTTDMLIGRATIHEKNAWMLRATAK